MVFHIIPQIAKHVKVSAILKHGQGASLEACQLPTQDKTVLLEVTQSDKNTPLSGEWEIKQPGVVEITIDNSHSKITKKPIKYYFSLNKTS